VKAAGIVLERERIVRSDDVAGSRYADMRFVNQATPIKP
jgi:hypothetical protein